MIRLSVDPAPAGTHLVCMPNHVGQFPSFSVTDITKKGDKELDIAPEPNDSVFISESCF